MQRNLADLLKHSLNRSERFAKHVVSVKPKFHKKQFEVEALAHNALFSDKFMSVVFFQYFFSEKPTYEYCKVSSLSHIAQKVLYQNINF